MSTPLIQLQHISKAFGSRVVLDGVSLDIEKNAITAIIGKSGVGKSVLVKHIIGLIEPDAGEIIFDGVSYSAITRKEFSKIKDRCSYMFQHNALFDSLTVFENIALPLREKSAFKEQEIRDKVAFRIDQLDLGEVAGIYPKQISGGMQKRVALARALITEPEIIFFDEPTTGLDPIRKNSVFSMIHHYHQRLNFTAVIITHDVPDIFYIAHRVHILDEGKIVFSGTPIELEQSNHPALYLYTHGQDLLVDDITGLRSRLALSEKFTELLSTLDPASPRYCFALRIRGLHEMIDFRGNLFAHGLIQDVARFLGSLDDAAIFTGAYSRGVFLIFARIEDKAAVLALVHELKAYFGQGVAQSTFRENDLALEIGCSPMAKDDDMHALVRKTLNTAKQLA
ncbi:MAG: ATP-binding cassette domain-containing protein [Deltaproteobacteria bacterium]|nr:ATP-binding cassette domain-containing protein [Deltaproteobacteria bacterium]